MMEKENHYSLRNFYDYYILKYASKMQSELQLEYTSQRKRSLILKVLCFDSSLEAIG